MCNRKQILELLLCKMKSVSFYLVFTRPSRRLTKNSSLAASSCEDGFFGLALKAYRGSLESAQGNARKEHVNSLKNKWYCASEKPIHTNFCGTYIPCDFEASK